MPSLIGHRPDPPREHHHEPAPPEHGGAPSEPERRTRRATHLGTRILLSCGVLLLVLLAVGIVSASIGAVSIPLRETVSIVLSGLGVPDGVLGGAWTRQHEAVILQIRAPRVVVGALVGAALGTAGACMQGVFRNPLAEPGVVGVSAGASVGAVAAIALGFVGISRWMLPTLAFLGAMGAIALVFAVSRAARGHAAVTMLLVGIAVNALLGGVTSILVTIADNEEDLRSIVFWLQGGLEARTWEHAQIAVLPIVLGVLVLVSRSRDLNLMVLGDEQARAGGLDVSRSRTIILMLSALVTGVGVAVSGAIAFVGMVVPHALRLVMGSDYRALVPASAMGGAAFLVLADLIARTAFSPATLRVGIITSLIGAPVLMWFVVRNRRLVMQ